MSINPNNSYIVRAFTETPWAILPEQLLVLEEIVMRHVSGEKLSAEEVQARTNGSQRPLDRRVNSVAVLPLFGSIFPRANMMTEMSGATSAERFGAQFASLVNDPEVGSIVLDVNSPGGQVYGIEELSRQIFDARGKKPVVAVANHMMASAAYWIGTAAEEVVVTPSSDVGSIGVFAVHQDMSAALMQEGIKLSFISAGKHKIETNPYQPLSEEARAAIQKSVNEAYDAFIGAIARNRGMDATAVRSGFGEGRLVSARQAVASGMADRVGTLEETINHLLNGNVSPAAGQANRVNLPQNRVSSSDPVSAEDKEKRARIQRLRERIQTPS